MGISELQKQLSVHREHQSSSGTDRLLGGPIKKKQRWCSSILYDPKEALALDVDVLRSKANSSFDALCETVDPALVSLSHLFNPSDTTEIYLNKKRSFLTEDECQKVDQIINRFIDHIGSYWQHPDALHCLEYLIRQYSIQKHNVDCLLSMSLPSHDTPLFVKLIQIIELPTTSSFLFLEGVAKSGSPLKRSTFVQCCIREPAHLSFLSSAIIRITSETSVTNIPLISFFSLCCIEAISLEHFIPNETFLRQIIPCIFFGLQNPSFRELHLGSLCIVSQMSQKMIFSSQTCEAIITDLFLSLLKTIQTVSVQRAVLSDALIFVNLLISNQTATSDGGGVSSNSGLTHLPNAVINLFIKERHRSDVVLLLKRISTEGQFDFTPLIGLIFRSLFRIRAKKNATQKDIKHIHDAEAFALAFIRDISSEMILPSNVRSIICFSAFEGLLHTPLLNHLPACVLKELETLYPTTVLLALRQLSTTGPSSFVKPIISSLCDILQGTPTAPFEYSDISSITTEQQERFSLWCTLTDDSPILRYESVKIGLDRLIQSFSSCSNTVPTTMPQGVRFLCKILLERSTDRHFPIAKDIFNCHILWANSLPSDSLTQLFYQCYLLIQRAASGLPWDIQTILPSASTVSTVLLHLITSASELFERLVLVLEALIIVNQSNPILTSSIMKTLSPIILPIIWSIASYDDVTLSPSFIQVEHVKKLESTFIQLFLMWNQHDPEFYSFAVLTENTPPHLNRLKIAELCIHQKSSELLSGTYNMTSSSDGTTVIESSKIYPLGPVTVVSLSEEGNDCPMIKSLFGGLLGGSWRILTDIEVYTCMIEHDLPIDTQILYTIILLTGDIWKHSIDKQSNHTMTVLQQFMKHLLTYVSDDASLLHIVVFLSLTDLVTIEDIIQLVPLQKLIPIGTCILGTQHDDTHDLKTTTEMKRAILNIDTFIVRARLNAAQLLTQLFSQAIDQIHIAFNGPVCIQLLMAPIIGNLLNHEDMSLRKATLTLVKSLRKYLKRHSTTPIQKDNIMTTVFSDVVSSYLFNDLTQSISTLFLEFDVAPILKSILHDISDITLSSAQSSVINLAKKDPSVSIFFLILAIFTPIPHLGQHIYTVVSTVPSESVLTTVLLPLWKLSVSQSITFPTHILHMLDLSTHYLSHTDSYNKKTIVPYICEEMIQPCITLMTNASHHSLCNSMFLSLLSYILQTSQNQFIPETVSFMSLLLQYSLHWDTSASFEHTDTTTPQHSLRSLIQETGGSQLKPLMWLRLLQSTSVDWDNENHLRISLVIMDSIITNMRTLQTEWDEQLLTLLSNALKSWLLQFKQSCITDLQHIVLMGILRCIHESLDYGSPDASCDIVHMMIVYFSKMIKDMPFNQHLEELCMMVLTVMTHLATFLQIQTTNANTSQQQYGQQLDLYVQEYIQHILIPCVQHNNRFFQSPYIATTLKDSFGILNTACTPVFSDTFESQFYCPTRSYLMSFHFIPSLVTHYICYCFSKSDQTLHTIRNQLEKERLTTALIIISRGYASSATPNASSAVAYLLLTTITAWASEIKERKKQMTQCITDSIQDTVLCESWILSICQNVISLGFNDIHIRRDIVLSLMNMICMNSHLITTGTPFDSTYQFGNDAFHALNQHYTDIFQCMTSLGRKIQFQSMYIALLCIEQQCLNDGYVILSDYLKDIEQILSTTHSLTTTVGSDFGTQESHHIPKDIYWMTHLLIMTFRLKDLLIHKGSSLSTYLLPLSTIINRFISSICHTLIYPCEPLLIIRCSLDIDAKSTYKCPSVICLLLQHISAQCYTPRLQFKSWLKDPSVNTSTQPLNERYKNNKQSDMMLQTKDGFIFSQLYTPLSSNEFDLATATSLLISTTVMSLIDYYSNAQLIIKDSTKGLYIIQLVNDLILTFGVAVPFAFTHQLFTFINDIIKKTKRMTIHSDLGIVLCRSIFSITHAIPSEDLLPYLNTLIVSLMTLWDKQITKWTNKINQSVEDLIPMLQFSLYTIGSFLNCPSYSYLSCHLSQLYKTIFFNPTVICCILHTIQPTFHSIIQILQYLIMDASYTLNDCLFTSFITSHYHPQDIQEIWRLTTTQGVKHPNLRYVIEGLLPLIKSESFALSFNTNPNGLLCGSVLAFLGKSLQQRTPDTVAIIYPTIVSAFISGFHAAAEYVKVSTQQDQMMSVSDTSLSNKTTLELYSLWSKKIQSGVITQFATSESVTTVNLTHPDAIIDVQSKKLLNERHYGFIEAGLILSIQSWLPKMTNSQLEPFIKSLLKYCYPMDHAPLIDETCMTQAATHVKKNGLTNEVSNIPIIFRYAASTRLFNLFFTTIVNELGDLGILSYLWDIVPSIKQTVLDTHRSAFYQSSLISTSVSASDAIKGSSKKKNKIIRHHSYITCSWWWYDVGLPSIICLTRIAKAAPSPTLLDQIFPTVVDSLDIFALTGRPKLSIPQDGQDIQYSDSESITCRMSQTWFYCLCNLAAELTGCTTGQSVKIQAIIQQLIAKIQSTENSEVRFTAVCLLDHLWKTQGVSLLTSLTDSLKLFVELLEDNDDAVEQAASMLIKRIENLTGESLQSRLRQ